MLKTTNTETNIRSAHTLYQPLTGFSKEKPTAYYLLAH